MALLPILGAVALAMGQGGFSTRIGLALMVPEGGGEEEFLAAIRQQIRIGLDGNAASIKWDEYEAQSGKPLADALGSMRVMGQTGLLTIGSIDTIKRRLPADVAEKAWDDPTMIDRWTRFLEEIAPKLGPRVLWVSLGNEVEGYLNHHPGEVEAYARFLAAGRATLRKIRPDLGVGVTVMCMESLPNSRIARRLQEGMDVTVFTYYPNTGGTSAAEIGQTGSHFDFMLDVAGSRPLLLQEIGYPASAKVGSSEEKQADFVRAVFAQLDRHTAKIPLAAYFMQSDFPPSLSRVLIDYYGLDDERFLAFLGSLGLCDAQGKPRAAWGVFRAEVARRKPA